MGVTTQKELAQNRFHILTSLLRLRQICCHPAARPAGVENAESAKVEALVEQLEPLMEEGQKVLVFSQFVEMLGLIRTDDRRARLAAFSTSPATRRIAAISCAISRPRKARRSSSFRSRPAASA